jgi:hypothetical protein
MKKYYLKYILFLFVTLPFFACRKTGAPTVRAYYYWQQSFDLSLQAERQLIDTLHVTKLYLKYFDVVWQKNEARPVADLTFQTPVPTAIKAVVPTVFIKNDVLQQLDSSQIDSLAARISHKIQQKTANNKLTNRVREWQIDCDWSVSTKSNYFRLLQTLKNLNPAVHFSATIRLHQLKYAAKTGVPPVDRGMLMLYNMSDVKLPTTRNSILDIAVTRQYISAKTQYALPLDVALPAFAWGVVLQGDKMVGLQNNWTEKFCAKQPFLHKNRYGKYICTRDTVIGTRYWRRGDAVRTEASSPEAVRELAALTLHLRKADTTAIALFSWDETLYNDYGQDALNAMWAAFE